MKAMSYGEMTIRSVGTNSSVNMMWEKLHIQTQFLAVIGTIMLEMQYKLRNTRHQKALLHEGHPTATRPLIPTQIQLVQTRQSNWVLYSLKGFAYY